jgi:hypothetical protein
VGPTQTSETGHSPLFLLAASNAWLASKWKRKKIERKERGLQFLKHRELVGASSKNREEREKNKVFSHWRIVYGSILMKFKYVVPDDKSFILIDVGSWISSSVA